MATFYKCINNGTIAIVSEEIYEKIQTWGDLVGAAGAIQPYPTPIFTFKGEESYATDRYRRFVTGDYGTMDILLSGHWVADGTFYVPFSNHFELQGGEMAKQELRFRTTLGEAIETFGLMPVSSIRS